MRILLINNYHFKKGGAEKAYFDTADILESNGHEVAFFSTKHQSNIATPWQKYFVDNVDYEKEDFSIWQKIRVAQKIIFNFQAKKNLEKLIQDFRPDIAHLHNTYHQLSPSIIYALKKHKIPMVLTLHDYKIISPNYNLFLDGKIWEKRTALGCIKNRCVKNSYSKSIVCFLEKIIHDALGSYGKIDTFISPSNFLIRKFEEFGFKGNIKYIPNPIENVSDNLISKNDTNANVLVYYGRLSKEKGVSIAIQAMKFLDKSEKLQIIGDGPEKNNLLNFVKKLKLESQIEFFGFKSGEELQKILIEAKAIIAPSIWYENMPYCIAESLALGKIVIASNIGGIPDLIFDGKNGFLFKPNSCEDLAEKIRNLDKYDLNKIKNEAKKSTAHFSVENYYNQIIKLFSSLI